MSMLSIKISDRLHKQELVVGCTKHVFARNPLKCRDTEPYCAMIILEGQKRRQSVSSRQRPKIPDGVLI